MANFDKPLYIIECDYNGRINYLPGSKNSAVPKLYLKGDATRVVNQKNKWYGGNKFKMIEVKVQLLYNG